MTVLPGDYRMMYILLNRAYMKKRYSVDKIGEFEFDAIGGGEATDVTKSTGDLENIARGIKDDCWYGSEGEDSIHRWLECEEFRNWR